MKLPSETSRSIKLVLSVYVEMKIVFMSTTILGLHRIVFFLLIALVSIQAISFAQTKKSTPVATPTPEEKIQLPSPLKVQIESPVTLAESVSRPISENKNNWAQFVIPSVALIISLISFYFSRKSWLESNRPLVTVRIATNAGGNVGSSLNIVVENTGNRPAKNIKLTVKAEDLESAMTPEIDKGAKSAIERCFSDRGIIPVLANGKSVSNSFGFITRGDKGSCWKLHSRFNVTLQYQDLNDREFVHVIPLLVADDQGFAGGWWGSSDK